MINRGDIVLVPFPFSDLSGAKVRPAVVVSARNDFDVTVAFISSTVPLHLHAPDFKLARSNPDFPSTGLKKTSVFRMGKLVTLHRATILRRLGTVSLSLQKELDARLKSALGV